jgi:PAS domain S-box-containing protein
MKVVQTPIPASEKSDNVRNAFECAAEAVASIGEEDIFEVLVSGAVKALAVDLAFIGIITEEGTDKVQSIAVCDRGNIEPNFEYALEGTPCEGVVGQRFRFYPEGIQTHFPDPHVKEIGGIGYAAIPLFDTRGRSMGLMAVVDRKPLIDRALTESVLKIFSVRAAVELERRHIDEARRRSEESYRSIFEAAEDALFIHDPDSGAILDVNPKACRVYGYTRGEMPSVDVGMLSSGIPPYTGENALALMERTKREGTVRVDWQGRNRDGTLHWDELYLKRVKIGGADRILAVTRDITERKRAEEERLKLEAQLRQAQKMEAIGQLTGGIAHDFNNILTGTMGYLVLAQEQADSYDDTKLAKYLDRAERSGQRAKALIQEMLTFSRGQRGESRSLQLGPQLTNSLQLLQSSLPSSVEIQMEFTPDIPCVMLDPLHVEQVLMNLCINARDAMNAKGKLRISLNTADCQDCVCSSCHQAVQGAFVELAVTDTGPGITADVLERMFEPFFSTKDVGKGSGMGLAMVHGIVHEYGGHIKVDTVPGEGSTIHIWFPAWFPEVKDEDGAKNSSVAEHPVSKEPALLQGRILLADDESSVREFMEDLLGNWGLDVTLVENGVEACSEFAGDPDGFDIVILDQTMPRMTGIEAAEQLHKIRPHVPVILYTGYSEHLPEGRVTAVGIRDLVRKPLDIPRFRALVESHLSGTTAR